MDATKEKKATSGHTSLMMVALNLFNVHVPRKKGLAATITAYIAEKERDRGSTSAGVITKEHGGSVGYRCVLKDAL